MHFPTAYFPLKFKVIMVFAMFKHAANMFPNIWNASLKNPTSVTSNKSKPLCYSHLEIFKENMIQQALFTNLVYH